MKADMAPFGLLGSFLARFARLAFTEALAALFELLDDCCCAVSKAKGGPTESREKKTRTVNEQVQCARVVTEANLHERQMVVLRALRTELRRNRTRGMTPFGPRWATATRLG